MSKKEAIKALLKITQTRIKTITEGLTEGPSDDPITILINDLSLSEASHMWQFIYDFLCEIEKSEPITAKGGIANENN